MQPPLNLWQEACQSLDWEKMSALLMSGDVHADTPLAMEQETPLFETALIKAINQGETQVARELLNAGADPNRRDALGLTPLHHSIQRGFHISLVELLLERGASVDSLTDNQESPLSLAARKGLKDTVETLLEYNPDPNLRVDGNATALMIACSMRWERICHALLDAGADASLVDAQGRTCLQRCGDKVSSPLRDRLAACELAQNMERDTMQAQANPNGRRI